MVNMTVPNSMVTKDQVYKINAKGCNNIKIPSVMRQHAASSMGPRRSHLGHLAFWICEVDGVVVEEGVDIDFSLLYLRTAPKVIPRRRCLRMKTVNTRMGTKNSVVPAATAGQS